MSAFKDYYLARVEESLGRPVTEAEGDAARKLYVKGWHPARTADYLKNRTDEACRKCGAIGTLAEGTCIECGERPNTAPIPDEL